MLTISISSTAAPTRSPKDIYRTTRQNPRGPTTFQSPCRPAKASPYADRGQTQGQSPEVTKWKVVDWQPSQISSTLYGGCDGNERKSIDRKGCDTPPGRLLDDIWGIWQTHKVCKDIFFIWNKWRHWQLLHVIEDVPEYLKTNLLNKISHVFILLCDIFLFSVLVCSC